MLKIKTTALTEHDAAAAAQQLYNDIYQADISLAIFYCSPSYDLPALAAALKLLFINIPLIGCTTAGEIGINGYQHNSLVGVSIASGDFHAVHLRYDHLDTYQDSDGAQVLTTLNQALSQRTIPHYQVDSSANKFVFLLIDGLSQLEEIVTSSMQLNLGNIPLFGGSAGDAQNFNNTWIYHEGEFHQNCALFTLVHTLHPFDVFKTAHFTPSETQLIVTEATPEQRIVHEINAEPAAEEYARLIGIKKADLNSKIFSAYPLLVRVSEQYYVRSIQTANNDGSLTFYCAIDEGIVLSIAQDMDLITNLEHCFIDIKEKIGEPELILGCDYILRLLELENKNIKSAASELMIKNKVIGFNTYGEQYKAMHMNQTFTGVAIGRLEGSNHE
jgi:hypothetical protein